MAEQGFILDIDTKFLKNLEQADKALSKSMMSADGLTNAFKDTTLGSGRFAEQIQALLTQMQKLGGFKIDGNGFAAINTNAMSATDKVNLLIANLERFQTVIRSMNKSGQTTWLKPEEMLNPASLKKAIADIQDVLKSDKTLKLIDTQQLSNELKAYQGALKEIQRSDKDRVESAAKKTRDALSNISKLYKQEATESRMYANAYTRAMQMADGTITQRTRKISRLREVERQLSEDEKRYAGEIGNVRRAIARLTEANEKASNSSKKLSDDQKTLFNTSEQLRRQLTAVFSVSAIKGYVNAIASVRGEFELHQKSLQAMLQSKADADALWEKTVALAVRSPFRVKELVTYTKQLAAYRVESNKLYETNKMLADISAGLGVQMSRLILAFGQVKAANYLRGTELRQFSEAGINILGELSEYFTELEGKAVTVGDVFERVSKRMVSFADVETVLKKVTDKGGIFYNMQEIQAETLKGQMANLKDSIDLMMNDIGKQNEGILKGSVAAVRTVVENWSVISSVIQSGLILYGLLTAAKIRDAIATGAWSSANLAATASTGGLVGGIARLITALKSLKIAMFGNPLTAFAATITTIGVLAYKYSARQRELNKIYQEGVGKIVATRVETDAYAKSLVNLSRRQEELSRANESLEQSSDEYEKNQKEIAKIEKERKEILKELKNIAPDFAEKTRSIITDTEALTKAAKEYNEELRSRLALEYQLKETPEDVENYEEKRAKYMSELGKFEASKNQVYAEIEKILSRKGTSKTFRGMLEDFINSDKPFEEKLLELENRKTELTVPYERVLMDKHLNIYKLTQPLISAREKMQEAEDVITETFNALVKDFKFSDYWKSIMSDITSDDEDTKGAAINDLIKYWEGILDDKKIVGPLRESVQSTLAKSFGIDWKKIESVNLEPWQKGYNDLLEELLGGGKIGGLTSITQNTTRVADQLSLIEGKIKDVKGTIASSKVEGQGVISEDMLEEAERALPILERLRAFLGGTEKESKKDNASTILRNRIRLIKQLYSEYEKLRNNMGHEDASKRILESYSDTFKKAFDGSSLSLTKLMFSEEKFRELKDLASKSGAVITDATLQEMEKLKESGTYIRTYSDELVEFIKKHEGFRADVYKDVVGIKTQGYGETVSIEEGVSWTEEKAEMVLRNSLNERYVTTTNKILDANKDLVLTQKQYNALLDVVYHGGPGALKAMIARVRDVEKGVAFIENVAGKIRSELGEDAAARFGEEFVSSFREAESIYERIALMLQATNLTAGGKITSWYKGMQKIADWRSEMFSGDMGVSNMIKAAMISINDADFTTLTGVYEMLKKLVPMAKEAGEEAELELSRAMSQVKSQIDVELVYKKSDDDFAQSIADMFSGYEISIELGKLNIPSSFAKDYFGLEPYSLEDIWERLEAEKAVDNNISKERLKVIKESQIKIREMYDKEQKERLKKYLVYARDAVGERAKIKLEELKKLQEIELTFGTQSTPEKQRAIKKVQADSYQATKKLDWEEFQKSDTFVSLFQDLDMASESLINHALTKLQEFKDSWKDMPHEEMKSIVSQIEKLEMQLIEVSDPFKTARDLRRSLKRGPSLEELQIGRINKETEISGLEDELSMLEQIAQLKSEGKDFDADQLAIQNDRIDLFGIESDELSKTISANKEKSNLLATDVKNINKQINDHAKLSKAYQKQAQLLGKARDIAGDLYGAFKDVHEVLGGGDDSMTAIFAEMGMNMMDSVINCLTLQLELKATQTAAQGAGAAINAALGPIGWAVMAVQILTQAFAAFSKAHDNKLEKQIQRIAERVKDLEERWERINELMSEAFSTVHLREYSKEAKKNLEEQIKSYEQMIELEEQKKKTDHGKVDEWRKSMKELKEEYRELLKEEFSIATSGIMDDVLSTTRGFVDAWHDAFMETRDGMSGLKNNFRELLQDIMRQQAALTIVNPFVSMYKTKLEELLNNNGADMELTLDEAREWRDSVEKTLPEVDKLLSNFFEGAGSLLEEQGELSELSKGIQGVTESTAQIIEALLNSMRFFVADTNASVKNIESALMSSDVSRNPILNELQQHTQLIRSIESMFDSVIGHGGSTHTGAYLKVFM